jgi:predicted Zn-ribbon and HTH transcriptional regulator
MAKNNKTIKERIIQTSKEFEIPSDKLSRFLFSIMELIERAKSPDLFCPKCDERMSINLEINSLQCFNCGFEKKLDMIKSPIVTASISTKPIIPGETKPNTSILKAIDKLEKGDTGKKSTILNLANSRGGGKITKEDDEFIKSNVPGAKNADINWS